MQLPDIHTNGTSKEGLKKPLGDAYAALAAAYDAIMKCAPNNRDYYTIGTEALHRAEREHRSRLNRIGDVMLELETLMCGIDAA